MSGNLRLNGATSGYSQLAAPDEAGDQTFTFPTTGGTLVTAPSGGSVPGYQQGTWTPEYVQGVNPSSYTSTAGRWSRVGNLVYIAGRIQGNGGSTDANILRIGKFPYKQQSATGEGAVTIGFPGGLFGVSSPFWGLIESSQDYFQLYSNDGTTRVGNDIAAINKVLHFSAFYITDNTDWTPINGATAS